MIPCGPPASIGRRYRQSFAVAIAEVYTVPRPHATALVAVEEIQ